MKGISLSTLKAGDRFRFTEDGEVCTVTRNCAAKPNDSPASGYIYYKAADGRKGRAYFLHALVNPIV